MKRSIMDRLAMLLASVLCLVVVTQPIPVGAIGPYDRRVER
jgi:hypothetical protein